MFIAALFTTTKRWELPKRPSSRMHTVENYSTTKINPVTEGQMHKSYYRRYLIVKRYPTPKVRESQVRW